MKPNVTPQLPGDVFCALSQCAGFKSARAFADTLAIHYSTLGRLEQVQWGSDPDSWPHAVKRSDLDVLIAAGWMKEGDHWWEQFLTAFAWQHIVLKYGVGIYDDFGDSVRILKPVWEEHVLMLVQAMVEREILRRREVGRDIPEAEIEVVVDRVYADVVFRLATTGYLLAEASEADVPSDFEPTRGVTDLLNGSQQLGAAYVRTLLVVMEWAEEDVARFLDDTDSERESALNSWRPDR